MEFLKELMEIFPWYAWVALIAIVGGTIRSLFVAALRHQQKMAMINKGLDPKSADHMRD